VRLTIIIPTKDRAGTLGELLESIRRLRDVAETRPEIIVADNNSTDETRAISERLAASLPGQIKIIKVTRPGKSATLNEALRLASGDYVAFLDDDVVVDPDWLSSLEDFFLRGEFQAGQGQIGLYSPDADDPETRQLISLYRTVPHLDHGPDVEEVHSLNGANCFMARELLYRVGGFDERLGPGASGTSEDVDLARRLSQIGIRMGYARNCIVYHRIDRQRLCKNYFEQVHRRQGRSRLLIKDRSLVQILGDLWGACWQYLYHSLSGNKRRRYKSLGRVFHYSEMVRAKRAGVHKQPKKLLKMNYPATSGGVSDRTD
jgi:glycosyltransferase involved in cell wall biosynthesis